MLDLKIYRLVYLELTPLGHALSSFVTGCYFRSQKCFPRRVKAMVVTPGSRGEYVQVHAGLSEGTYRAFQ